MSSYIRPLAVSFMIVVAVISLAIIPGCSKSNELTGNWKGKFTVSKTGKILSDLEFPLNQNGREITGTMIFTKLGVKLPLTGTVTTGKISLSSPMQKGLTVSLTGTVENPKSIKGTAVFDYDTPQLGKRQDQTSFELTR